MIWRTESGSYEKDKTIARKQRQIIDGFILHSDRGVQYACNKIGDLFKGNNKIHRNMSRKGNCWDNAVTESFFKTIKSEMIYQNEFKSLAEFKARVGQ